MSGDGFANPIVDGSGALVYPSIHSPNFVHAVSGWTINKDGSAEFDNLTIRGTFLGSDFILNSNGLFLYSGVPALGNLIASMASGPDPFGNPFESGVASFAGANFIQMIGAALNLSHSGEIGPGFLEETGAGSQELQTGIQSVLDTAASITQFSALASPTGQPLAQVNNQLRAESPGGMVAPMPITQTDATTFTVTAAAATQASKAWSVPANDANVGTVYRLTVWGFGTQGSTAETLAYGLAINGVQIRSATLATITASGGFRFRAVIDLHIVTTGAGGTCDINGSAVYGTGSPQVAADAAMGSPSAGAEAFDTAVANTLQLDVAWGSVTGVPTITTIGSSLERIGP